MNPGCLGPGVSKCAFGRTENHGLGPHRRQSSLVSAARVSVLGRRPSTAPQLPRVAIRIGLTTTSVFSRRNPRRHRYLQVVAKTLYTVGIVFTPLSFPPRRPVIRGNFTGAAMYSSQQQISSPEVVELRKATGLWLKELRERRGLSQRQMAEKVGGNYYTFISQLESGRGRIPPDRYLVWAQVLGVEPKFFVRNLLRSYDPITYSILFGESEPQR
jgi:DNA-binding XRE family transcriptional regulator